LKTAFWNYDRTQPLVDGRVGVKGHVIEIELLRPEITFARAFSDAAFDICELSFSNTVTAVSKGEFPYVLIPVFLSRAFRHSAILVRADRRIEIPADLRGKTLGLQEYDMTAAVVVRGLLRDQYGVGPQHIHWRVGDKDRTKPLDFPLGRPPPGVDIQILPPDRTLGERLLAGELDGVITLRPLGVDGRAKIVPLFPDPVAAERAWYSNSHIFPIMHAVGVRKSLLNAAPELPVLLFEAFSAAKDIAVAELEVTQAPKITLPWPHAALAEARALMGPDPWPYGIAANRHTLETQLRWSRLDGLQARPVAIEDIFARECLDT
jgi:4,5-dihydroxyphthalate decarboxylase